MSSAIPPPVRAVAGLAAWSLEEARRLPTRLLSLPVLAAGAAMQASLKLQQEYAQLVARGDELLVRFGGRGDEPPPWATFDDDGRPDSTESTDAGSNPPTSPTSPTSPTPTAAQRRGAVAPLLAHTDTETSSFDLVPEAGLGPDRAPTLVPERDSLVDTDDMLAAAEPVPGYDGWTVAQLRARLRRLSAEELGLMLAYEQSGRGRAPYLTMLGNRLAAQNKR